jgi:hypothetical protein
MMKILSSIYWSGKMKTSTPLSILSWRGHKQSTWQSLLCKCLPSSHVLICVATVLSRLPTLQGSEAAVASAAGLDTIAPGVVVAHQEAVVVNRA